MDLKRLEILLFNILIYIHIIFHSVIYDMFNSNCSCLRQDKVLLIMEVLIILNCHVNTSIVHYNRLNLLLKTKICFSVQAMVY